MVMGCKGIFPFVVLIAIALPQTETVSLNGFGQFLQLFEGWLTIYSSGDSLINGVTLRHPDSGGKCMDIKNNNFWSNSAQVILYDCFNWAGVIPVNRKFNVLPGSRSDTVRYSPMFSHVAQGCISSGTNEGDIAQTTLCKDNKQISSYKIRELKGFYKGRDHFVMLQHLASAKCLRVDHDGTTIRSVRCHSQDTRQHWAICGVTDPKCGKI